LSRALWEAYIIEGLDNIKGVAPGRFALYIKMHHSGVDDQSGAEPKIRRQPADGSRSE
jgi:hypothetical protein